MAGSSRDRISDLWQRYRQDPAHRELLHSSFISLLIRGLGVSTGFLVTWITARFYGADALGVVSICVAILSLASVFGKLGMDVALMRFITGFATRQQFDSIKGVYVTAMRHVVPISLGIAVLLWLLAEPMADQLFHKPDLAPVLRINAWCTLPLVLLLLHSEAVRGLKHIGSYTFFQTAAVSTAATLLLFLMMTVATGRFIPVYIQFVCITLVGLASCLIWLRGSRFFQSATRHEVSGQQLRATAGPMFTTTIMQLLMSWAGTLILASHVPEAEVGIYNALVRISVFTNITILAINSIALPRFAEAWSSGDRQALRQTTRSAARMIFLSSLPIFLILAIFPATLLSVFGKDFAGHEFPLYLLLAGQFIVVVVGLPSQLLNMTGRQAALRNISIVSAVINIGACLFLIPAYGMIGACVAQIVGTLVWNSLCVYAVYKEFGFWAGVRF